MCHPFDGTNRAESALTATSIVPKTIARRSSPISDSSTESATNDDNPNHELSPRLTSSSGNYASQERELAVSLLRRARASRSTFAILRNTSVAERTTSNSNAALMDCCRSFGSKREIWATAASNPTKRCQASQHGRSALSVDSLFERSVISRPSRAFTHWC